MQADKALLDEQLASKTEVRKSVSSEFEFEISQAKSKNQQLYDLGLISKQQLVAAEIQLEKASFQHKKDMLAEEAAEYGVKFGDIEKAYENFQKAKTSAEKQQILTSLLANKEHAKEIEKIWDELQQYYQTDTNNMDTILKNNLDAGQQAMQKFSTDMTNSFSTAINNIIQGTKTLRQAFQQMAKSIIQDFIKDFTQPIVQQMAQAMTKMLMVQKQTNTQQVNNTAQTANTQSAIASTSANAQIAVATSAANVAQETATQTTGATMGMLSSIGTALSSIPWYGWVGLAILAGVAAGESAENNSMNNNRTQTTYYQNATVGSLQSYDVGSWSIPTDMVAQIHQGEMIIPAKGGLADGIRNLISGGSFGGGPSINPNIYYNATAMDGKGIASVFRDNSRDVTQGIYRVGRQLGRQNPTRWGL